MTIVEKWWPEHWPKIECLTPGKLTPADRWPYGIFIQRIGDPSEFWPHGTLTRGIFILRIGDPMTRKFDPMEYWHTEYSSNGSVDLLEIWPDTKENWPTFSMDNLHMLYITWGLFLKTYNNRKMRFLCVGMILISLPAVQRLIVTLFLTTRC